jgi:hypothetical protein
MDILTRTDRIYVRNTVRAVFAKLRPWRGDGKAAQNA